MRTCDITIPLCFIVFLGIADPVFAIVYTVLFYLFLKDEIHLTLSLTKEWLETCYNMGKARKIILSDEELYVFCKKNTNPILDLYILGQRFFFKVEPDIKKSWFKNKENHFSIMKQLYDYSQKEKEIIISKCENQSFREFAVLPSDDNLTLCELKRCFK